MSATIESVLQESRFFPPSPEFVSAGECVRHGRLPGDVRRGRSATSRASGPGWRASTCCGRSRSRKTLDESNAPFFKWFDDGELNASYNCLDRHLKTQPDKTAIIFEADDGKVTRVTYKQLYHRVCRFANALKARGIKKGDRVLIYMPMSIEAVVAMQACARIGAMHSVVFGGFSAKSVHERIVDAGAVAVITADGQMRGGKRDPAQAGGGRGARHGRLRAASRT